MRRAAVLVAALVCVAATAAMAGSVSFASVCSGYRLAVKAGDLLIYCPPQAAPWLTIRPCPKPRASRDGSGNLTVTCG